MFCGICCKDEAHEGQECPELALLRCERCGGFREDGRLVNNPCECGASPGERSRWEVVFWGSPDEEEVHVMASTEAEALDLGRAHFAARGVPGAGEPDRYTAEKV